jgi:hypothetical protein
MADQPPPRFGAADRNLLFGIVALQMDFIDSAALVGSGVLLEQGGGELLAEVVGALLALGEGDEVVVGGLGEQEVEGGGGLGQETAA